MKPNKNLKITKRGNDPLQADYDSAKSKFLKDKSPKRRLSIYDDFDDENLNEINYNYDDEQFDDE